LFFSGAQAAVRHFYGLGRAAEKQKMSRGSPASYKQETPDGVKWTQEQYQT
jgi:hypothetical protein